MAPLPRVPTHAPASMSDTFHQKLSEREPGYIRAYVYRDKGETIAGCYGNL